MCFGWGIAPWDFDDAATRYRQEMLTWYGWRMKRKQMQQQVAEMNRRHFTPKSPTKR